MRLLWAFVISVMIYLFLIGAYLYYFKPVKIIHRKPKDEHIIKIDIRDIPRYVEKIEPKKKIEKIKTEPKKLVKKKPIPPKKPKKTPKKKKPVKAVESEASAPKKPKSTPKPPTPIVEEIFKEKIVYIPETVEVEEIIEEPIFEEEILFIEEEFIQEEFMELEPVYEEPIAEIVEEIPVQKDEFIAEEDMLYIPDPIFSEPIKTSDSLSSLLGEGTSTQNSPKKSPLIQKLYGSSFDSFTPIQKKFIVDNLGGIHRITQSILTRRGYPAGAVAMRTGQEGENIVSFDLHPNGDISNLRLEQKVGYRALDENTLQTIKIAYKDYPYPQETTHIVFYVEYSIFGY